MFLPFCSCVVAFAVLILVYLVLVQSNMLYGIKTWPVRKENEVALQQAEMRMVRWMCNVKVKYGVSSKELRERLRIDDNILGNLVPKDCQARNLNREDAVDRSRWKKLIKIG